MKIWHKLINHTKNKPQIISCCGVNEENIVSFFKNSPLNETEIDFNRDKSDMRKVEL